MKQTELREIPYGETFSVFGDTFVALDRVDGNVLAIRKEIWKSAPFDTGGVNDLRTASITGHLVQYFEDLCKNGASEDTVAMNTMDLKATDCTREYGTFGMRAGLLTLEQYGKYQHIIPDADYWWWLATPWRTPAQKGGSSDLSWSCSSNGRAYDYICTNTCGIRPALLFSSALLVSATDDDAETAPSKEELYRAYREYVKNWLGDDSDANLGESPLTFEEWQDDLEDSTDGE